MALISARKFSFLTFLICSIGLIIQIYHVSHNYFMYITQTNIEMEMPLKITVPSLSSCWLIPTIFNQTRLELSTGRTFRGWSEPGFSWFDNESEDKNELTVSDIFDYTPNPEEIFDATSPACSIRIKDQFVVKHLMKPVCMKITLIEKYIQKHYMCYKMKSIRPNESLQAYEYAVSPSFVGMIFKVHLNREIFKESNVFSAFVHNNVSSDYYDSLFASEHFRPPPENRSVWNEKFVNVRVSFQEVMIKRLPPPYNTMCEDYRQFYTNTELKMSLLNNRTMDRLNRVTTFMQLWEPLNYPMVSPSNFRDKVFLKEFNQIIKNQTDEYGRPACYFSLLISSSGYHEGPKLSISVYWPRDPRIEILYQPEQEMNEFLIYVCSVIGIWYGLSMMSVSDGIKFIFYGPGTEWFRRRTSPADRVGNQLVSDHQVTRETNTIRNQIRNQTLILDQIRGQMFSFKIKLDHVEAASINHYLRKYNRNVK